MKKLILTALAVGLVTAFQPAAQAQFGSGIVFDPTQAGHAVTQIEHEEQSIANEARQIEQGQQIFTNTVKIATTALQAYNVAKQQYELTHQMILAPRMLYARFLSPTSDLLLLQQISNTYGNSMGWLNSANTGKGAAASYQQVSVPNTAHVIPGYGTASVAGQMQIAAQGATVDITDSVMTNNLQALGTIRANQTARQTDIANLEAATQSQDVSQQTIMAELQRINQALLLQLRTLQDANQINANLALQQIVSGLSTNNDETTTPTDCLSARMANDRSPSIAPANPGFCRAWRHPAQGAACGGTGGHSGTDAFRFLALLWLVRRSREKGSQSWRLHRRGSGGHLCRGAEGPRRPDSFLHGGPSGVYQSAPAHELLPSSAIGNLSRAQPGEVSLCSFQH